MEGSVAMCRERGEGHVLRWYDGEKQYDDWSLNSEKKKIGSQRLFSSVEKGKNDISQAARRRVNNG